ncbi:GNAT family N-acetyltransferase [Saccharomonospora halophila]|uniref:GNAT family N-acetyltransferase n=1 Tax=Saccharomonospora halophila TaxID=129922 RepID=UPI00039C7A19|nr:GNAT family N-acetyltransferase [Saccharomonospora halophila]
MTSGVEIVLRPATVGEADALTELALRSKGYWGYDRAFLETCRDELTLHPTELAARRVVVADSGGEPVGFYSLEGQPPDGDLGYLFVEPTAIGHGIGGQLWDHMCGTARSLGFRQIRIESDPGARPFYESRGASLVGTVASTSVPGRELPLLRYVLPEGPVWRGR